MSKLVNEINTFLFVALALILACQIVPTHGIKCYKCKGDDECNFKGQPVYMENCTWATKCWGARIGDHFIRGCADDRCDIQIGVGSYVESKCCYTDLCNNESFFFPNSSVSLRKNYTTSILFTLLNLLLIFMFNKV